MKQELYFIALLPGAEISREVLVFQEFAARQFDSSRALRSPPHITLFPPFKLQASAAKGLKDCLKTFAHQESAFYLSLQSFNCFAPRVIFADVTRSEELMELQMRLERHLEKEMGLKNDSKHAYNPHLTVAFKDLKPAVFPRAWAHFSKVKFERFFAVERIALLKHNGRRWELCGDFPFGVL